jgi:RHS repeat-associated protein
LIITTVFIYDAMNRPVQINNPLNYVATYGYNKAGLLESVGGTKNANDVLDFERETVSLSDDQDKFLISETKTVENGSTITTPVSTIRYQYTNHLGSASLELDHTASIISYEEYHPFGTTSYRSGRTETECSQKRYKYCGKEKDEESGLYYYGARYYAQWICRFVSVDPLQHKYPIYTPFQYAGNKPIIAIDIDGLESHNVVDDEEIGQQKLTVPKTIASSKRQPLLDPSNPSDLRDDLIFGDKTNNDIVQEGEGYWLNLYKVDASCTDDQLFKAFHEMSSSLFTSKEMTPVLEEMINFFESNSGGDLGKNLSPDGKGYAVFTNDRLNQEVQSSEEGLKFLGKIQEEITKQINTGVHPDDVVLKDFGDEQRPKFNDFLEYTVRRGLTIAINDTQAFEVTLSELTINEDGTYTGIFNATIYDHFGLDEGDVTKNLFPLFGFRAWYRLQRERGYRPFVTKVNISRSFSGTIK